MKQLSVVIVAILLAISLIACDTNVNLNVGGDLNLNGDIDVDAANGSNINGNTTKPNEDDKTSENETNKPGNNKPGNDDNKPGNNKPSVDVTELKIDKANVELGVGETLQLVVTLVPENATDKTLVWESSNSNIVSVANGLITAVSEGSATVFAKTVNDKLIMCNVTVKKIVPELVILDKTSITLESGEIVQLTATIYPQNAIFDDITWESSDTSVARVENGLVTARSGGTATITARVNETIFANATVTVNGIHIPNDVPEYDVTWKKTKLIYELTKNDVLGEFLSGCERYYAGTAVNCFAPIDEAVRKRNFVAAQMANVDPDYRYVNQGAGWGANIDRISKQAIVQYPEYPDIYCNFAYDLTCAQIRGCFANLLDTTYDGGNWFRFSESDYSPKSEGYFDTEADEGYFYEYMKSLSLSEDKMYCLASNYTIDVIRAMAVIPVNVAMFDSIASDKHYVADITNASDFYKFVWRELKSNNSENKSWDYDCLAHYGNVVYSDAETDNVLDNTVAFAAGCTSGLISSAILYSIDTEIIKYSEGSGKYSYYYPMSNHKLNGFVASLQKIFGSDAPKGIITVTQKEANDYTGGNESEIAVIREKFAENKILFGGVELLGNLEHYTYQNMKFDAKGFGFLPLPGVVYTYTNDNDRTQSVRSSSKTYVHNVARIIAIAKGTTKFAQCSAYLDYNSRMSSDIVDEYGHDTLEGANRGLEYGTNNKMLTYIRNRVGDCFDKTFEDISSQKMSSSDDGIIVIKWHEILSQKRFVCPDFSNYYDTMREDKAKALEKVVADWYSIN